MEFSPLRRQALSEDVPVEPAEGAANEEVSNVVLMPQAERTIRVIDPVSGAVVGMASNAAEERAMMTEHLRSQQEAA